MNNTSLKLCLGVNGQIFCLCDITNETDLFLVRNELIVMFMVMKPIRESGAEKVLFIVPLDISTSVDFKNESQYNNIVTNSDTTIICTWSHDIKRTEEFDRLITTNLMRALHNHDVPSLGFETDSVRHEVITEIENVLIKRGVSPTKNASGTLVAIMNLLANQMRMKSSSVNQPNGKQINLTHNRYRRVERPERPYTTDVKFLDSMKGMNSTEYFKHVSKLHYHDLDESAFVSLATQYVCIPIQFFTHLSKLIDIECQEARLGTKICNDMVDYSKMKLDFMTDRLFARTKHTLTEKQTDSVVYHFLEQNDDYICVEQDPNIIETLNLNVVMIPHYIVYEKTQRRSTTNSVTSVYKDNVSETHTSNVLATHLYNVETKLSVLMVFDRLYDNSLEIPITHREYMMMQLQLHHYKLKTGVCAFYSNEGIPQYYAIGLDQNYINEMMGYLYSVLRVRKTFIAETQQQKPSNINVEPAERHIIVLQQLYYSLKSMFKTNHRIKTL